ncbi:YadA family autotransporter adhesin, partial [Acinetobacter sp. c2-A9]|uniref:YadA family autotransporter adhesin n=1 Tax=Acinetobacter sp. c2-A9 TaxID=3342802 RepID=UPI0035B9CFD5
VPADQVTASMNSGGNTTVNSPTTLGNVKSTLAPTTSVGTPTTVAPITAAAAQTLADSPAGNNAATVKDVLNAGWNLQTNATATDFVKPYDTVNFKDGANTKVVSTTDGATSNIQVNVTGLPVQYTTTAGVPVTKVGNTYYEIGADGNPDTTKPVADPTTLKAQVINPTAAPNVTGTPTVLGNVNSGLAPYTAAEVGGTTGVPAKAQGLINLDNAAVPNNNVATVGDLRNMGWVVSTTGNGYEEQVKNANQVDFVGINGTEVTGKTVNGVRTVEINAAKVINSNVVTGSPTIKVTAQDVIDPVTGKPKVDSLGNPIKNFNVSANTTPLVVSTAPTAANNNTPAGKVETPDNPSALATAGDIANAINNSGFNVTSGAIEGGVVSGTSTQLVNPSETVKFQAGKNMVLTQEGNTFTYAVSDTPVFKTVQATDGVTIGAGKTAVNMTPATTTAPVTGAAPINAVNMNGSTFTGLAPNLPNTYSSTTDLAGNPVVPTTAQTAPVVTATQMGNAASLGDVLNAGWNLQNNGTARDFVKPYDTVNFVNGKGTVANVTTSADGKNNDVKVNVDYSNLTVNVGGNKVAIVDNGDGTFTYNLPAAGGNGGSGINVNGGTTNAGTTTPTGTGTTLINGQGTSVSVNPTTGVIKVDSPLAYKNNVNTADTSTPTDTVNLVGAKPVQMNNLASGVRTNGAEPAVGVARAQAIKTASGDALNNAANIGDIQSAAKAATAEVKSSDNSVSVDTTYGANGQPIYDVKVNTAGLINQINQQLGDVAEDARAGTSAAMAMASLPQAYIPGKSMLTGGISTYRGQGAIAVGLSKLSDNGRWVLKLSGTADTKGNAGAAAGAGFHF